MTSQELIPLTLSSFDKNWSDRTKDRMGTWGEVTYTHGKHA